MVLIKKLGMEKMEKQKAKKNTVENVSIKELAGIVLDFIDKNFTETESESLTKLAQVLNKTNTEFFIRAVFGCITNEVKQKKTITTPIGRFIYKLKAAKICNDFRTKKKITIDAAGSMAFAINAITKEELAKIV